MSNSQEFESNNDNMEISVPNQEDGNIYDQDEVIAFFKNPPLIINNKNEMLYYLKFCDYEGLPQASHDAASSLLYKLHQLNQLTARSQIEKYRVSGVLFEHAKKLLKKIVRLPRNNDWKNVYQWAKNDGLIAKVCIYLTMHDFFVSCVYMFNM